MSDSLVPEAPATPVESSSPSPYAQLVDVVQLKALERISPGSTARILDLIDRDMTHMHDREYIQDTREHKLRLIATLGTLTLVVLIAGMATAVIIAGYPWAGSFLASADLVALANVLVNSWRR